MKKVIFVVIATLFLNGCFQVLALVVPAASGVATGNIYQSAISYSVSYGVKKTTGKTAGLIIVASGNSGFTDVQTLLTQLMSYFNVITNPRSVFVTADTVKDAQITSEDVKSRLKQLVDETLELARKVSND